MKTLKSRFTSLSLCLACQHRISCCLMKYCTIPLSFRRCDWLFPPSAREVSYGNRPDYKPTRERVVFKGLYGRWRLHLMGSCPYPPPPAFSNTNVQWSKWPGRVHHVVVFKTKFLHFKIENTPIKTNRKRKFNEMLSFFFVDKRKLFALKLSFEEFNLVSTRGILALSLF